MDTLRVWVNNKPVGRLSRHRMGTTFVYDDGVDPADAVSLAMPVRVASYDQQHGMLPVFDISMPEGYLLSKIERALGKDDSGRTDPIDVLALTGGNQIGRIRILPEGQEPERRESLPSIDALLQGRSNSEMIADVIERYALRSGVAGAMPKILVTEQDPSKQRTTLQTRDWIMKFDDDELPGLSMNEFHCMAAAKRAGNDTAEALLSDDGRRLFVKRFDALGDERFGFEDFASLNGKVSKEKYKGSLETGLLKTTDAFSGPVKLEALRNMYRQIVTSIALRNGDAHLKNFALLFNDAAHGVVAVAPAYDIVTTRAFDQFRKDTMALTLEGSKDWPDAKKLKKLAVRARLSPLDAQKIFEEVGAGIAAQLPVMVADMQARGFDELAERMAHEWKEGLKLSLGLDYNDLEASSDPEVPSIT